MNSIAFIGGGSFGTALAIILRKKGCHIKIYDREKSVVDDININRRNSKYLEEGIVIPEGIKATTNLEEAITDSQFVVLAVPSHVIRDMSKKIKPYIAKRAIVVSIAKGIEETTNKRLSKVIEDELNNPVVVLSGPSHAEEVAKELPTTIVATSQDMKSAEKVQDLFMTNNFRVYTNDDIVGVEIGGAVKNIIALAVGIIEGLKYGDNTKAALMTRGMKEIARIATALGGKEKTFYGLTGIGDLIVTCTSVHSRNRRAGILIGEGKSLDEAMNEVGMVVEGVKACKAFYNLKEEIGVSMPITDVLYKALYEFKDPEEAVKELMSREKTYE